MKMVLLPALILSLCCVGGILCVQPDDMQMNSDQLDFIEYLYFIINFIINLFPENVVEDENHEEVMLIAGGITHGYNWLSSVEIFDPSNPSLTCTLPDMNVTRYFHAAAGLTVCGDHDDGSQSCETWDGGGGQWTVSHQLHQKRKYLVRGKS